MRDNSFLFYNNISNIDGVAANSYQCGRKKNLMNSNEIRGQWNYPLIYFGVRAETVSASIQKMLVKSWKSTGLAIAKKLIVFIHPNLSVHKQCLKKKRNKSYTCNPLPFSKQAITCSLHASKGCMPDKGQRPQIHIYTWVNFSIHFFISTEIINHLILEKEAAWHKTYGAGLFL